MKGRSCHWLRGNPPPHPLALFLEPGSRTEKSLLGKLQLAQLHDVLSSSPIHKRPFLLQKCNVPVPCLVLFKAHFWTGTCKSAEVMTVIGSVMIYSCFLWAAPSKTDRDTSFEELEGPRGRWHLSRFSHKTVITEQLIWKEGLGY